MLNACFRTSALFTQFTKKSVSHDSWKQKQFKQVSASSTAARVSERIGATNRINFLINYVVIFVLYNVHFRKNLLS